MPKVLNGKSCPDYDKCETVEELEAEFKDWAYYVCLDKFCKDYKISDDVNEAYKQHIISTPKEFLIVSTSQGNFFYYYGVDKTLKKEIQSNKNTMDSLKQKKRIADAYSDIKKNTEEFGDHVHDSLHGKYDYDEETRNDLKKLANTLNDKTKTEKEKRDAIDAVNAAYNLNIALDATGKEVKAMATKTSGGFLSNLSESFAGTGKALSESWNNLKDGNFSTYFDQSSNEYLAAFRQEGISGDVLWGVITGKYNKDAKAKQDLLKLSEDLNNGTLTDPHERARRLAKLNEDYGLNLSDDVTPEELSEIIQSNQQMEYKNKVSEIAKGLIEAKINDEIANQLDKRLGSTLRSWGIDFTFKDRNLIQDIRDIIRGVKKITFEREKFLKDLQTQLENKINKLIEEKVYKQIDEYAKKANNYVDDYAKKINNQLDVYRKKVDSISDKLETWVNNPQSFQMLIADKLDNLVKTPVEKVAGILDKIDKPFEMIGLGGLGLGNMFRDISGIFMKGVAEKIRVAVQPVLTQALTITKTISETIKRAMEAVNKLRDQAKAMIETWKNTLKDAIATQTKKLVNEIVKYVRLNLSGFTDASGITSFSI